MTPPASTTQPVARTVFHAVVLAGATIYLDSRADNTTLNDILRKSVASSAPVKRSKMLMKSWREPLEENDELNIYTPS